MGRSVKAAAQSGVRHAIQTSIDADLVSLVSALSLFFLASASVKGFGLTLALGILCDIVMMLLFKAPLVRLLAPRAIAKHPGFWNIKDGQDAAEQFAKLGAVLGVPAGEAEIGEALHLEEGTVKSRLFRARKKLCEFLQRDGNLPDTYASKNVNGGVKE